MIKYMTPGPIQLPNEVLDYIKRQPYFHRSNEFKEIFSSVLEKMEKIVKGNAIIFPGTGTLSIDTMVYNYVNPKEEVILLDIGEFSKRLGEALISRGARLYVIKSELGEVVPPDVLQDYAKKIKDLKAIAMVHNETSLGVANRYVEKIQEIAKSLDAVLLVDSVSGIPAERIDKEIDVIATASHKAFMSIPGASIIFYNVKPRNLDKLPLSMDLNKFINMKNKFETPYTPPINVIYGLDYSTSYILKIGLDRYTEIHKERSDYLNNLIKLKSIAKDEFKSNTVSAFYTNNAELIVKRLREKGYAIATGMGDLSKKVIRIGLMGDIDFNDIKNVAEVINEYD
ncbi:serine-pyruvate aminotransferase/archaeal aspartate aminotransferase [Caldisphaera lagunensis DSM 15908]|uniref:Serine-pyruvate aminotransferase/archaeal aspartate aminotransferase n=1 Tax=Caldisphaera lagunensis (strain DSM 15908 / JCM 11604 / ANMR 0165 / IC-154) TaxID=1056495 RepID=L0ACC4_CALLD|nr:aminotransferase class V-fold PLP-dependent enzyme [Caldisphaera lagunensis]AFZ70690.1 serine-pyruvate aminotransferase/archaeal aspartate aminotransferase [Caldisphaera lagunensis DSM 15908]